MTPAEASKLISEMANSLEALQKQVEGLAVSLERLQIKVGAIDKRLAPPPAAEA